MDSKTRDTGRDIRRERVMPLAFVTRAKGGGAEKSRRIEGCAIRFNEKSQPLWEDDEEEAREVISPEAVTREVLDACDIKFTMYHDRQCILARSKEGKGTLSYDVRADGVYFSFDAPETPDGDTALALIERGDIDGCSFAFSTHYWDEKYVSASVEIRAGKAYTTYTVRRVTGVYDFTITPDPAYPTTSVRELREGLSGEKPAPALTDRARRQIEEMRREAGRRI